jgi:hypothetical protein
LLGGHCSRPINTSVREYVEGSHANLEGPGGG